MHLVLLHMSTLYLILYRLLTAHTHPPSSFNPTRYSIYIRPTAIGTAPYLGVHASEDVKLFAILSPVGPYFKDGFKAVKLYADTENVRAWPGGVGNAKVGGNYGPGLFID